MMTLTENDITEKYVYNVKNQLKELHNKNGINYFTYDKQGNTIKEETTTGNNIFEYNTLNQQVKAITKEGNTLVSKYDTEGLRAEIEENEKLTKFIFHKENVLVETDKEYNCISRFVRGYEVVAADIADLGEGSESNLNRHYYTVDEQGSTIFITDKNQKVKNEYYYDAFGNVLDSKEEVHNRITYTGQQFDGITGQYYLRARFYNPVIGRFTQEDIYRGDGLNLYAYCANNPIVYYDPSGYKNKEACVRKGTSFAEGTAENGFGTPSENIGNMLGPNPKKVVKEYDIVPYRPANGKYGLENHHGVMNEWAKNNVDAYREFERVSPTIALSDANNGGMHENTKRVYEDWCRENYGKPVGAQVDWGNLPPREIQNLSEKMFDAAKVPESTRRAYYRKLNQFLYNLPDDVTEMSRSERIQYGKAIRQQLYGF